MGLRETRRNFGIHTIAASLAACLSRRCFAMRSGAVDHPNANGKLGDGKIHGEIHGHPLTITTTSRVAGAVDSIRWNGLEFVDSYDHGRQIQSAASFDCSRDDAFWPERFNPTEAGSRSDGAGPASTSQLLTFDVSDNSFRTKNRMAFWLPPGEKSFGRQGLNETPVSNHLLKKEVQIGCSLSPNAIEIHVEFQMPADETHRLAQFEVLTGYMPESFQRFWKWDFRDKAFGSLDDGPGEQPCPLAFSNAEQTHSMGVWMPEPKGRGYSRVGYGRFRFAEERVVKWNCVVRARASPQIEELRHPFRIYIAIGSLEQVAATFRQLAIHGSEENNDACSKR